MAFFFIPYPLIQGSIPESADLLAGFTLGVIFFLSQFTCFLALQKGDASMVTPIMGAKPVFVAFFIFTFGLTGVPSPGTWVAVLLATIAIGLIAGKRRKDSPFSNLPWFIDRIRIWLNRCTCTSPGPAVNSGTRYIYYVHYCWNRVLLSSPLGKG